MLPNGYRVDDRDAKTLEMTYQFAPAGQPEVFCRVSVFKPDQPPNPTGFLHDEFFSKLKDELDDNANNSVFWHDERKLPNPGQWADSAAQMNYTGQDFSWSPAPHFWGMVRVVVSRAGYVYAVEIRFHSDTEKGVADAFKRNRPAIIGVLDSFRVHF